MLEPFFGPIVAENIQRAIGLESELGSALQTLYVHQGGACGSHQSSFSSFKQEFNASLTRLLSNEKFVLKDSRQHQTTPLTLEELEIYSYGFFLLEYEMSSKVLEMDHVLEYYPEEIELYKEVLCILENFPPSNITELLAPNWKDFESNLNQTHLSMLLICSATENEIYFEDSVYYDLQKMVALDAPLGLMHMVSLINRNPTVNKLVQQAIEKEGADLDDVIKQKQLVDLVLSQFGDRDRYVMISKE